jgi:UDP-4-amino-4,6-dideoxy-N-acetyl-beta-L-altrosamine N-acetyltransferase
MKQYETLSFVRLNQDQIRLVFEWRNHENIRRWMINPDPIEWEDHLEFLKNLLARTDRQDFLVLDSSLPLGVINLTSINMENRTAELGMYKDPFSSRSGVGEILLRLIEREALKLGLLSLFLRVKIDNLSAQKVYQNNGFRIAYSDSEYNFMSKVLKSE